jgi:3-dehydroquinate dehydratase-2
MFLSGACWCKPESWFPRDRVLAAKANKTKALPLYVLNGPTLNLLGVREPEVYGRLTLADIEKMVAARAKTHGLSTVFRQSNHEGELIDWIIEARTKACGVILNGGAFTHTSIAIHDAIRALGKPLIEVHLSNPHAREEFRHRSYVSLVANGVIVGLKEQGYVLAVDALAHLLKA